MNNQRAPLEMGHHPRLRRAHSARRGMLAFALAYILISVLSPQTQELAAQSKGGGITLKSPETVNTIGPSCDGLAAGYETAPEPVPGSCMDYVKECVASGSTASWQSKNVLPSSPRPCTPTSGVNACQAYSCATSTGKCGATGAPATCPPSADGCTTYQCDPANPGTCKVVQTKDPNSCVVTWQDQPTPCGQRIIRKVTAISDPCCTNRVGDTETTTREASPCTPTPPSQCTEGTFEVPFTATVNGGTVPSGNRWAMRSATGTGMVMVDSQSGSRLIRGGSATISGSATGSLGGWSYRATLAVSWSNGATPNVSVQLLRPNGVTVSGEVRNVTVSARQGSLMNSTATIQGEARVPSTSGWHDWAAFSIKTEVMCQDEPAPCDLFVAEVEGQKIDDPIGDFGHYSFDKVFPPLKSGTPSCLNHWRDKISKMAVYTEKDPKFWDIEGNFHYHDDYWAIWFLDDLAKVRYGVFYNDLKNTAPNCSSPCTKDNTPRTPQCWCNPEARIWAYGAVPAEDPGKIECVKRAPVGAPGYVHWEGACIDTKIYLDAACNVIPVSQVASKRTCGATKITFYPSSPISLMWNTSRPITAHGSIVQFALDKSRSDNWYMWHGSEETPLLVYDPAHKGAVTSADQLFGNWTFGGQRSATTSLDAATAPRPWRDGYEALETLDHNGDGEISGTELEPLALWFDRGSDAVVGAGEVRTITDLGVTKLFIGPRTQDASTRNIHVKQGYAVSSDGTERIGETVDWFSEGARTQAELLARQQFAARELTQPEGLVKEREHTTETSSTVPDGTTSALANDPRLNGAWFWKAKEDKDTLPRGMLLITARTGRAVSGLSVTEIPVRDVSGTVKVIQTMRPFTGTISSREGTRYRVTFTSLLRDAHGDAMTSSEAEFDLEKGILSGKTTESMPGDRKLTYQWEARK